MLIMYKVLITSVAKSDILKIKEYIETGNINASTNFLNTLFSILEMLAEYPNIGVEKSGIKNKDIKIFTMKKKYNIVYRLNGETIEILRVLNKYQNLFAIL